MRISRTREIDAPADRVWQVVGPGFADVGTWASEVAHSQAAQRSPGRDGAPAGRPCDGRVCSVATPGFDEVREDLLAYDDDGMTLTYRVGQGMPGFVTDARNTWSVQATGPDRCRASMAAEIEVSGAARLALPVLAHLSHRLGRVTLADLAHYVTTGEPSRRKRRAVRRRQVGPLTRTVRVNAAFSAATGVGLVAGAPSWASHLGSPPATVVAAVGAGLLGFAAVLAALGRTAVPPRTGRVLAALDLGWVLGTGVLLAIVGRWFSLGGWIAVVATSAVVTVLGARQWRHSRTAGRVSAARRRLAGEHLRMQASPYDDDKADRRSTASGAGGGGAGRSGLPVPRVQ